MTRREAKLAHMLKTANARVAALAIVEFKTDAFAIVRLGLQEELLDEFAVLTFAKLAFALALAATVPLGRKLLQMAIRHTALCQMKTKLRTKS